VVVMKGDGDLGGDDVATATWVAMTWFSDNVTMVMAVVMT
jgi:hypothetical protein